MATYKVIQDIEAEDKLLGPLSLRQFIYAIFVVIILFVAWQLARIQFLLAIPLLIPAVFFGLLAAPLGVNQSSEIWLLAKIRFFIKPRRRIWDQSGIKELVTITVPKKLERHLTNDLSQTEVKSRLKALANTIDSRGWAVKNVNVNMFSQPGYVSNEDSDRLIDVSGLPKEVVNYDVTASDDILDEQNNPTAQHLNQMINSSTQTHRQQVVTNMQKATATNGQQTTADYWFMSQNQPTPTTPGYATFDKSTLVAPGSSQPTVSAATATSAEETALLNRLHSEKQQKPAGYGHMRTIDPVGSKKVTAKNSAKTDPATGTKIPDPAILELANNDDLNVATIARQANKKRGPEPPEDEVVISLR